MSSKHAVIDSNHTIQTSMQPIRWGFDALMGRNQTSEGREVRSWCVYEVHVYWYGVWTALNILFLLYSIFGIICTRMGAFFFFFACYDNKMYCSMIFE